MREKDPAAEFDKHSKDIKQQLAEQLHCLDARVEAQGALVIELQDYFRKRADIEADYSRALDRLIKQTMAKHKVEKPRRLQWPWMSVYDAWHHLLATAKQQSRDHGALAEVLSSPMQQRLQQCVDDSQRIFKQCREIGTEGHDEIIKVLAELQSTMQAYHKYHAESAAAEAKLKQTQAQKKKAEDSGASRKLKTLQKSVDKKQAKYSEAKIRALKARNEYLICVEAANAATRKYFVDDLSDLIDCMDFGYHNAVGRALLMFINSEEHIKQSMQSCIDVLTRHVGDLDPRRDKQNFLEQNNTAFTLPKKFEFQHHKGDEVRQISAQTVVQEEMVVRLQSLTQLVNQLRMENDETWKSLETAEKRLMEVINQNDYDVHQLFQHEKRSTSSDKSQTLRRKDERLETENYYLKKFRSYTLTSNKIARIDARQQIVQRAVGEDCSLSPTASGSLSSRPPSLPPKPVKRRIGRMSQVGAPRLFGGSLEEYLEATNQEVPLVVESCIRVINRCGMHHQGIFRISGSQLEIQEFKNAFEKGEDPLQGQLSGRDLNSVAGVLKLYFRELREPLFPTLFFDEFINATRVADTEECVQRIRELIQSLHRPTVIVMRYLFAFLSHLSENSDENMMDPYNIAICFGPTLLPIPPDRDQVAYQTPVIDLVKLLIIHHHQVFPYDGGMVYEKFIVDEEESTNELDNLDALDNLSDDEELEEEASPSHSDMDDEPVMHAVAKFEFTGRTQRELSFHKGDLLQLFKQVSPDWWEGSFEGRDGLIPNKYITLNQRPEESSLLSTRAILPAASGSPGYPAAAPSPGSIRRAAHVEHKQSPLARTETEADGARTAQPPATDSPVQKAEPLPTRPCPALSSESAPAQAYPVGKSESTSSVDLPSPENAGTDSRFDELASDIDSALAEVLSGLQTLRGRNRHQMNNVARVPSANPKHTPDLVLDLPDTAHGGSSASSPGIELDVPSQEHFHSQSLSGAQLFANDDTSTLKKTTKSPEEARRPLQRTLSQSERRANPSPSLQPAHLSPTSSGLRGAVSAEMLSQVGPQKQEALRPQSLAEKPPVVAPRPALKPKPTIKKKPDASPATTPGP